MDRADRLDWIRERARVRVVRGSAASAIGKQWGLAPVATRQDAAMPERGHNPRSPSIRAPS